MIALDIEGTGVDAHKNSILSIGAIDTDNPNNQFYEECRVWEGSHISDEALTVNGFMREEIEGEKTGKQSEGELIQRFVAWALAIEGDRTFIAQTPGFDRSFVQAACERAGIPSPFAARTIDTHTLCWQHMVQRGLTPPTKNNHSALNLDFARTYCGLPEEGKPHNGLTGALGHAEVFSRIAYTKKLLPDFEEFEIPWTTTY